MELAVHIALLTAAVFYMAVMVLWDVTCLQRQGYASAAFIKWCKTAEEAYSFKRIIVLAAIVVSMARLGYYVEGIVAAVIALQAVALLVAMRKDKPQWRGRAITLLVTTLAVMVCAVVTVAIWGSGDVGISLAWAARIAMLLTVLSTFVTVAVNRLLPVKAQATASNNQLKEEL